MTPTPKCKAKNKHGKPCQAYPVKGATVCKAHGGLAPQVKAKAQKRYKQQQQQAKAAKALARLGEPQHIDPTTALLDLIRFKAGEVAWYRHKISELGTDHELIWGTQKHTETSSTMGPSETTTTGPQAHMWLQLMHKAEDQLARFSTEALRAGIEERRIRLEEQQAEVLAHFAQELMATLHYPDQDAYTRAVMDTLHRMADRLDSQQKDLTV